MKTVWIIPETLTGLVDNQNEALKQHIAASGMIAKVLPDYTFPVSSMRAGDVILVHGWNAVALDAAKWRDVGKAGVKLAVYLGAPGVHDAAYQEAIGFPKGKAWRELFEEAIIAAADLAMAPSEHARTLGDPTFEFGEGIKLVGGVVDEQSIIQEGYPNLVAWEGRALRVLFHSDGLPSDNPKAFEELKAAYAQAHPEDEVEWIDTNNRLNSRGEVLAEMARCRVVFSAKLSDPWPADLVTAAKLGAYPLAPNRLGYGELMPEYLYEEDAVVQRLHERLHAATECTALFPTPAQTIGQALEAL